MFIAHCCLSKIKHFYRSIYCWLDSCCQLLKFFFVRFEILLKWWWCVEDVHDDTKIFEVDTTQKITHFWQHYLRLAFSILRKMWSHFKECAHHNIFVWCEGFFSMNGSMSSSINVLIHLVIFCNHAKCLQMSLCSMKRDHLVQKYHSSVHRSLSQLNFEPKIRDHHKIFQLSNHFCLEVQTD